MQLLYLQRQLLFPLACGDMALGLEASLHDPGLCGGSNSIPFEFCRAWREELHVQVNNLQFPVRVLCPWLFMGSLLFPAQCWDA